jgi:hypothetical protein
VAPSRIRIRSRQSLSIRPEHKLTITKTQHGQPHHHHTRST